MHILTKSVLRLVYPKRKQWIHKGHFGKLAVVGGSHELTGSCCFAGMAAYRAGCDVVYVIAPERAADAAAHFSPNLITVPLQGKFITPNHLGRVVGAIHKYGITAVVLGPGMGREEETIEFVHQFLTATPLPIVIDADGIRAFAAMPTIRDKLIFTPHAGEFFALAKTVLSTNLQKRAEQVAKAAKYFNVTLLAKGNIDIVSDGKRIALNKTGSPYMTKGGMGDTLAGITGAYLARGIEPFAAACAAAYVNGAAGAYAAKKLKEGVVATDLLEAIPLVL